MHRTVRSLVNVVTGRKIQALHPSFCGKAKNLSRLDFNGQLIRWKLIAVRCTDPRTHGANTQPTCDTAHARALSP